VSTRTLPSEAGAPMVEVAVRDTGCGIPARNLPHIFDPFFTTKPVGRGTGLGLDIVQRLLRKHAGEVIVDSQPGRTEFRVNIPLG
jgi:two-component system NtrC family sensor kinase